MTNPSQPLSLADWVTRAVSQMEQAGIDQALPDALWMGCHVLGVTRGELEVIRATSAKPLSPLAYDELESILARRLRREPLWHILGQAPFLGMELAVGPGVFSPRPETELLAHQAISDILALGTPDRVTVWDIGAGSGAIGLAIAQAVSYAEVTSVEPSDQAHPFLDENISRFGDGRVRRVAATAAEARGSVEPQSVDVVVSNPPYLIRESDWVDEETGGFDPDAALYADDGGLAVMADVVEFAAVALRPAGLLIVEHGTTHNEPVAKLMASHGFTHISHLSDLVGRPRITRALAPNP